VELSKGIFATDEKTVILKVVQKWPAAELHAITILSVRNVSSAQMARGHTGQVPHGHELHRARANRGPSEPGPERAGARASRGPSYSGSGAPLLINSRPNS
jgi:hypothetical protein